MCIFFLLKSVFTIYVSMENRTNQIKNKRKITKEIHNKICIKRAYGENKRMRNKLCDDHIILFYIPRSNV